MDFFIRKGKKQLRTVKNRSQELKERKKSSPGIPFNKDIATARINLKKAVESAKVFKTQKRRTLRSKSSSPRSASSLLHSINKRIEQENEMLKKDKKYISPSKLHNKTVKKQTNI